MVNTLFHVMICIINNSKVIYVLMRLDIMLFSMRFNVSFKSCFNILQIYICLSL